MFVKAFIPKGTQYIASYNDYSYSTNQDYYTTVEVEEQDLENDQWIKHLAKANLVKTIAKREFGNYKYAKCIWLDLVDIQIIR